MSTIECASIVCVIFTVSVKRINLGLSPESQRFTHMAKPLILVVEDNLTQQKVIALLAEEYGYKTTVVTTGGEALAAVGVSPELFTVILMDIALPDFDGTVCSQRIRDLMPERRVPIIAMSAFSADDLRTKCAQAGMDDYLEKPFTALELKEILQKWSKQADPV